MGRGLGSLKRRKIPDREVETIQDLIYYQYARIIARRASGVSDGKEAKAGYLHKVR